MSLLCCFSGMSSLPSSGSVPSLMPRCLGWPMLGSIPSDTSTVLSGVAGVSYLCAFWCQTSLIGRETHDSLVGIGESFCRHFTVPESTARLLKKQYLAELNNRRQNSVEIPEVTSLPTNARGRPRFAWEYSECPGDG